MNLASPWSTTSKFLFRLAIKCRSFLPKKKSQAFGSINTKAEPKINHIWIINLDRQPARLAQMKEELKQVLDCSGNELWNITERFSAIDARQLVQDIPKDYDVDPFYTLEHQLFVEPQPLALPTKMDLNLPIKMSRPEIAVARSHIEVWRQVVVGNHDYVLILEDDVWFKLGFVKSLDLAWAEIHDKNGKKNNFDIFYLSYEEVKHGTPKIFLSSNVFQPVRGLWNLSGYVVSRKGAEKLLQFLPCRGPIDLWINHKFAFLDVKAIRRSVISQRGDISSTNSYSILPSLTKIGAITSEGASLFNFRPIEEPVFAFGSAGSGLSSLAMALSMLGYRCCSDLKTLPNLELEMLLEGKSDKVFNAYVNIKALEGEVETLRNKYPRAKFIITLSNNEFIIDCGAEIINDLIGSDTTLLHLMASNKWHIVCSHLRCAPPAFSFPELIDLGQRELRNETCEDKLTLKCKTRKRDKSPWVIEQRLHWQGICFDPKKEALRIEGSPIKVLDNFEFLDTARWILRNDTFTDNLALFRPSNIELLSGHGVKLNIKRESLGLREYSAASLTSHNQYLYGRFEATIKVSNVPGIVTGFFLYRDSPRQEIDIEIVGNRTNRLLVNVFYNPGGEGAKFDYGYSGAASYIDLGFDASESYHHYAIEWGPLEICWFVDNLLVHRRVEWDPTPIPHLPMALHINAWPCRSKELAGKLTNKLLPTITSLKSISLEANQHLKVINEDHFV